MTPPGQPYQLTPADIMDLRGSVRWQLATELTGNPAAVPVIRFDKVDRFFYLHSEGHVRCRHQRIEVLGACLRMEAAEPGWIKRALDSRETCFEALLDAETRAQARATRAAEEARHRNRIANAADISSLTLDDFLGP